MTESHRVQAALWVVGLHRRAEVVRFRLAHGEDPEAGLRSRGFVPAAVQRVLGRAEPHEVTIVYRVEAADGIPPGPAPGPPPSDPGLRIARNEVAVANQRVAAYAVVLSNRGVLLSQASAQTNAAGAWGLPGGGVDPGELPEEALHREVWEETGQRIEVSGLAAVSTRHWVGRAPSGRLEDFHAVRIIYRATCPEPTESIVLDEGGTTAASAWVPVSEVAGLDFSAGWRERIGDLLEPQT